MKARVALLASIFCLSLVAIAAAQVSTVEGTVVSNSGGSLVIDTDSGQRTFMVDAQSSLPADLAVGSRVRVEYHTLANDKFHAFKVTPLAAASTTTTGTTDTTTANTGTANSMTGTTTAPTDTTAPAGSTAATGTTTAPVDTTSTTTTGTMQERPKTDTTTTTTDTTMAGTSTTTDKTAATPEGRTLPATASPLPLLALAGAISMAGGALLRRIR